LGHSIGSIFKRQAKTLEDGTDKLYRNIGNYHSVLKKIPEELRPQTECVFKLAFLVAGCAAFGDRINTFCFTN